MTVKNRRFLRRRAPSDGRSTTRAATERTGPLPRLPHERDESAMQNEPTPTTDVIRMAAKDVAQGRVDTDARGQQAAEAFDRAFDTPEPASPETTKGKS